MALINAAGSTTTIKGKETHRGLLGKANVVQISDHALSLRTAAGKWERVFDFAAVHDQPTSLEVSPDDRQLAVGTDDGLIYLFAVQ
jgi:hypothetical protein